MRRIFLACLLLLALGAGKAHAQVQGLRATTAEPPPVPDGQSVPQMGTPSGKQVVMPYATPALFWRGSITGTTGTLTIPNSSNAALKSYMTGIQCFRSDAGTTAASGTLNDTASTVVGLPNTGGGGGNNMSFQTPLAGTAVNTAFAITLSATVTSVTCNAQGYFAS